MEIRKILNILESGQRFKKLSGLREQPTSDQIATAALNQSTAPQTNALGVTAQANVPTFGAPATATPANQAAQPAQSAPAQKTYGAGYDPNKVQYAYSGGKPTAPPPPSANLDAAKKAAFSGTTPTATAANTPPAQPASAAASANLDAAKTAAVGGTTQPAGQAAQPAPVAASPSGGGAVAAFGKTAMANAPASADTSAAAPTTTADASGATKGIPAAFGQMAEDELEEELNTDNSQRSKAGTITTNQQQKPSVKDIVKADRKEIDSQFTKTPYESPYNKDTKAIDSGSKSVNTMADFEESVDYELAEMMRLSGLPIMEKAASKQQQKFMGMVHAMQKGEKVKGASPELKKAAKGMSKKAAKDFASTKHAGLPKKVTEDIMLDEGGSTLNHIANRFKYEVKMFMQAGVMDNDLYEALSDYYIDRGEVPYGVAKGKPGYPDMTQWVEERFYADMGSDMNESAHMYEVVADPLNELAKLAGLEEDGAGQFGMPSSRSMSAAPSKTVTDKSVEPVSQFAADLGMPPLPFFSKKEKADYEAMKARKAERDFQQSGSAYKDDSGIIYDREGNPRVQPSLPAKDYFSKDSRARDLYNMQFNENLNECGDMDMEHEDSLNVSTNMSTDGTKNVTISAQGDKADELLQMLKMAGMRPHDDHSVTMSEPEVIMISSDQMMDEGLGDDMAYGAGRAAGKAKRGFDAAVRGAGEMADEFSRGMDNVLNPVSDVYPDETRRGIKPRATIPSKAPKDSQMMPNLPRKYEKMPDINPNYPGDPIPSNTEFDDPIGDIIRQRQSQRDSADNFNDMNEAAKTKKLRTRYSNTPDEEYETVNAIIRQGNDLNREKRQYASKPRLGDNPMAESILDSDLNAMLESILLRDDKDEAELKKDPKTGRVSATYPAPKKPDQSTLPLQTEPYHGPRSLKVDGERTGTEDSGKEKEVDEGLEDVSNFFGDIFNTDDSIRRRSQQYRDLEAMQQKYKPGTPEYDQLEKRKGYQKERYYGDKGEVVDKHGEPIKVLPPDQWKGN